MEVMIPLDFDFKSAQVSAPSTPRGFGEHYFSAPASPSRLSQYYTDFDELLLAAAAAAAAVADESGGRLTATVPFHWEEKPGVPKSPPVHDFVFDVSQEWEAESLSAEELFDAGVIKPLKPPPPPRTRRIIQGAFSPRQKNKRKETAAAAPRRGRGRDKALSESSSRRAVRSLSPLRDNKLAWEEEEEEQQNGAKNYSALSSASIKGQKKWSLKDLFLFRSASEGRAADKDPLKKYTAAAFRRSIESPGSGSGSRRRGPVSAHELHYTVNRAVSEDLKKKTFLPYNQGILGRLAFNPAAHALANGFGFSRN